ncbi:MAG TPA: hypothetical protein VGG03_13085 [Thermoanaerobaculia bacterium]|jgi:hypothetical protein
MLQPPEEIEEPLPAELLADADVPRPFEPYPGRRLRDLPPFPPRRQLRHLAGERLASLRVDPGLLGGIEALEAAEERETLDPGEISTSSSSRTAKDSSRRLSSSSAMRRVQDMGIRYQETRN